MRNSTPRSARWPPIWSWPSGALQQAVAAKADILLLSELFLTGYFPEDLFFKPRFVEDALHAAGELVRATKGTGVSLLLPTIWREGQRSTMRCCSPRTARSSPAG